MTSPAKTAMFDQAQAASTQAERLLRHVAEHDGSVGSLAVHGPARRVADRLANRLVTGQLRRCDHIGDSPQVMFWMAWRPGRLRCLSCAADAFQAINGTPEDKRCDGCKRICRGLIHPSLIAMPAVVAELAPGLIAGSGPILMHADLPAMPPTQPDRQAGRSRGMTMHEHALDYAGDRMPVLPLHTPEDGRCSCRSAGCDSPGKHPRTLHGKDDATTDTEVIARWWTRWPTANIGIRPVPGLVVLDVDPRSGGNTTLAELIQQNGPLPETLVALGDRRLALLV